MQLILFNQSGHKMIWKKQIQSLGEFIDEIIGGLKGMVNMIFCGDAFIHSLNKKYRKKDTVTDVLTFTYYKSQKTKNSDLLGEIIIDLEQARRQANKDHTPFPFEVYKLCIHGLLHLRGYDHEKNEEYRVMKLLEDKIMKMLLKRE